MKIAIMQPYIFPYIGYFQLMHAVDKFVILDDVNYINKGWINRNKILVNGKEHLFTVPLKKASQNKLIMECELSNEPWKEKFLKTIEMNYKKAPFFNEVFDLIKEIVNNEEKNFSTFLFHHFQKILSFLGLQQNIIQTSSSYNTKELKAQEKIIAICKTENASHYINPIGGIELYDKDRFKSENIRLNFLKTSNVFYQQFSENFVPSLSIIDILMFNSKSDVFLMLNQYNLE